MSTKQTGKLYIHLSTIFVYLDFYDEDLKKSSNLSALQRIGEMNSSKDFLEQCTYFIGLTGKYYLTKQHHSVWIQVAYILKCKYLKCCTDLYEFHSSCYYNETMPYCPVQVKLVHNDIKQSHNGAQFLLQVWKRGGKRVFEKALNGMLIKYLYLFCVYVDQVQMWTISYKHFIYQPSAKDLNHEYLHIVDFSDDSKIHLVKNFTDKSCKYHPISSSSLNVS